jgi:Lysylphosphatidylglycerol synthase TM region
LGHEPGPFAADALYVGRTAAWKASAGAVARERGRLLIGCAFAALTLAGTALVARHLTHTSWPLQRAHMGLVALAGALYFASFILRALGWQKLFPARERPDRARCLAACGAAAASGAVLPFRLDYLVKIGTLRRLGGIRLTLEAIALSIVTLGLVDAVAFLPLSISATATSSASLRVPLILVVLFGVAACGVLAAGPRLSRLPFVRRHARLRRAAEHVEARSAATTRSAIAAGCLLLGCWTTRALGSTVLLASLGVAFSPTLALVVLCLGAAASLIPITSGGAIVNVSTTAGILLALGIGKEQAINFGLASGLLLCGTALLAALIGVALSLTLSLRARTPAAAGT